MLAPVVELTLECDFTPLAPVADRGKRAPFTSSVGLPEVEDHRLACGLEGELVGNRKPAIRPAVVFAKGEERDMRLEKIHRILQTGGELQLETYRIRLQVNQPTRRAMLRSGMRSPVQVDDQRSRTVKMLQLGLGEAIAACVRLEG